MASQHTAPPPAVLQHIVHDVLASASPLMDRVIEAARLQLQTRESQARTPGEHQAMLDARQQIARLANVMSERYPEALRKALDRESAQREKSTRSLFSIQFDELELMDETQITESVERARAQQMLVSAVEGPLADLDALVSAAQGHPKVLPEQNPLRPEMFLQALQAVVSQMQVAEQVRRDWMGHMAQALGAELRTLYPTLTERLKQGGVQPAGYAMRQAGGQYVYVAQPRGGAAPGFADEGELPAQAADPRLTLDRLRRLLLGEIREAPPPAAAPAPGESFAERFAREFEGPDAPPPVDAPATDFAMTVPAAFEALQEMNQVGQMMDRLGSQPQTAQRQPTAGLAQALSMEVVALMVDNIARDERLLWPVQQFVRALEPALLQLALADPRFFSNKEHPARRLLQEITDRSQAFNSTEAPGFQRFLRGLITIAGPLSTDTIEGADDFERVLQQLQAAWAENEQARKLERQRAIQALQHAEQRHLLAAKLSREIAQLPQMGDMPDEITRFLTGPWAQVMAEAQLTDKTGSPDPGGCRELVESLIWSAQPSLTRLNTDRLARLLPKLVPRLREGLDSIGYPPAKTEPFFDVLMQLHQQAFKLAPAQPAQPAEPAPPAQPAPLPAEEEEQWVAPAEAKDSGFMEASLIPAPAVAPPAAQAASAAPPPLAVGTWVNLRVRDQWERTQLSWVGPHGTMFLFTNAAGRSQSMTLRVVERLIQQGAMQVLAQQNVVDGALDAVAQAAMRNSVDSQPGDCS
ncbi:MAG: DUF1631 family protein [Acidovorax sp.]|uniref:DUF1631 family protein n=1 Tax=Acidovorax sp. TaxID=1872122 RepID=UPI0039E4E207